MPWVVRRWPLTRTPPPSLLGGAYAMFAEGRLGRLSPGYAADLVVVDRHVLDVDLRALADTKVIATVVDGVVRYENAEAAEADGGAMPDLAALRRHNQ